MDGVDVGSIVNQISSQNMGVHVSNHNIGKEIDFNIFDPKECILCYGDIDFVRQFYQRAPFIPGAWCNFRNMRCSTYYAYLGKYLLNKNYTIVPLGDLSRRWDEFAYYHNPLYPSPQEVFIRPDSGTKPFTGYVVNPEEKHKIQTLSETVGPETLVVIAPKKEITKEWRFVVCDKKIIAGCQYLPTESQYYDTQALCLAIEISRNEWEPDRCYTIDIAESEGKMYLLEINSFSCSGFYACNIESIVRCAGEVAIVEWMEYYS